MVSLLLLALCATDPAAELAALAAKVPAFQVIALPAAGTLDLTQRAGLTVDDLRGIALDPDPPVMGTPANPYPANMDDDYMPGAAPYQAADLRPFRLRRFTNEFNYGGWHNFSMLDYAATHGFSILTKYNRQPADFAHYPAGTQVLNWGGFIDWHTWLPEHGIADGRYDQLVGRDVVADLVAAETFKHQPGYARLMIDLEHGFLAPPKLREQDWFPKHASAAEQAAFEQRYYDGYALTYTAPVEAARRAGWKEISLYGWQPFGRTWFGLEQADVDPASYQPWLAYGRRIHEAVDILNPSVYCFYWSPQNVAYTLANLDLNRKLNDSATKPKPMVPYYWTLMHGGGGGWRWWANQPLGDEEVRAMCGLAFFCGIAGLDTWNWSGTGNHHYPDLRPEQDVMVNEAFRATAAGAAAATEFARYDMLHIVGAEEGRIRFQKVIKDLVRENYGVGEGQPTFTMLADELELLLRPRSAPVAAMVEALALIQPFENILADGAVMVDVSAQEQYAKTLPIVRRVKLGVVHLLATYDPQVMFGGAPRTITLANFDGVTGRTLILPADGQLRVFALRDE